MKWALTRIFFVIVLVGALWVVLGWRDSLQKSIPPAPAATTDTIVAMHTYQSGTHTLTGKFTLPTPCHDLKTEATVAESYPERVTINFIVRPPEPDAICIQVLSEREFTVQFKASPNPAISAKINGRPVPLVIEDQSGTLQPIQP